MIGTTSGNRRFLRLTGIVLAAGVLAGCDEAPAFLQSGKPAGEATPTAPSKSTKLSERDIEAPEVFQATEAALWDGRPSLGGVWVAHPDVTDPQRVMIRNTANDKSVVGALFRRERDIPGPRIQASSDAAEALSMLAGAPVKLDVVALVREPVQEAEEDAAPEVEEDVETTVAAVEPAPDMKEEDLDPIAGAAAAIEASELEPAATAAPADPVVAALETDDPKVQPRKKSGIRWPWSKPKPAAGTALAGAAAVGAADAPAARPRTSELEKPYIQIGIFNVEKYANNTADQLRKSGLAPTVFEQSNDGKAFWRVVVGPSYTKSEQSTLLKTVKDSGFSDAYTVTH